MGGWGERSGWILGHDFYSQIYSCHLGEIQQVKKKSYRSLKDPSLILDTSEPSDDPSMPFAQLKLLIFAMATAKHHKQMIYK